MVSQLKINYSDWKAKIMKRFDFGHLTDDPQNYQVFSDEKLPKYGKLRTQKFLHELAATKVIDDRVKKDKWGRKKRGDSQDKALMPSLKKLDEVKIIQQEFLVDRPKKYVPKYLPKIKRISFEEYLEEIYGEPHPEEHLLNLD